MISNLIQNIGKCRDLIADKNKKQIICKIGLFAKVCDDVKVQMYKYIKNYKHPLDFNYADLQELSDELADYLKDFPAKFRFNRNLKDLTKNETIDNKVIEEFINKNVDDMYIDARLRDELHRLRVENNMLTDYYAKTQGKIEELEHKNIELKNLKEKYYLQILTDEKTISDLITENKELKDHYELQLKVMIDKFNDLKQKTNKEYMDYSKELGLCRQKLEKYIEKYGELDE